MNYLVTFHTHFDAIQYSKFIKSKGLACTLKPVPRKVSSSCGTCAFFESDQVYKDYIREGCEEIFSVEGNNYVTIYKNPEL